MSAPFDVADVLAWTGGARVSGGDARFTGVSIDTRTIGAGQLFVAIAGERFDAHDFLEGAIHADQVVEIEILGMADRNQPAVPAPCVPAEGALLREQLRIGHGADEALQGTLGEGEHAVEALEQCELERARHERGL